MKDTHSKKDYSPAYLRLYSQMRSKIVSGSYPLGSKLPSKRTIAEEAGVSVVTAEHAYALLCDEGYIEARQRSGYFVCFRTDDGFASAPTGAMPAVQPHHLSDTPEFPFSILARTMRSVISDHGEGILERSPNPGCVQLRQAIARYLARSRNITAEPEQIIIGSGAEYLYSLVVSMLGRGRSYAIEAPSYPMIRQVYGAADVKLQMLPLGTDGIESPALWASCADILHISPYRSFPSGITASASKRHEYLRWADAGERYIVEDDFESEFSVSRKPEETLYCLTSRENVIYMNSFSKTVSPSLRVGYMVLPKSLLPAFEKAAGFYSCTVPTYIQLVLAALLESGDFERHINRVRRQKRKALSDK